MVDLSPPLPNLTATYKDKNREYTRHFCESSYKKTQWLTGSAQLNKLFCWPCLRFSAEETVWTNRGYGDLNNICKVIGKHEKTKNHISCFFKLQTFGDARVDLQLHQQYAVEVSNHNEMVKRNREILARLINAVCFHANQELSFRGHDKSTKSLNKGNYVELLLYTAEYDPLLHSHLKTSTVFTGTSPLIQNDLIAAVGNVLTDALKQEIQKACFVPILLDETSDINISQLSTCIRYVCDNGARTIPVFC
jgi:hypothetical protein